MSLPLVTLETPKSAKVKRAWISHDDLYNGDYLRGWHYAVHTVHTASIGISLIPNEKNRVAGYDGIVEEKNYFLTAGSLIFTTPLATSDWAAALKTELKGIQIVRGSKGRDGYILITLYQLNDSNNGVVIEKNVETTQGAVIAHLQHGTPIPDDNGPTDAAHRTEPSVPPAA